jgi:hypothetical protein
MPLYGDLEAKAEAAPLAGIVMDLARIESDEINSLLRCGTRPGGTMLRMWDKCMVWQEL